MSIRASADTALSAAELIIEEFGHKVVRVSDADVEDVIDQVDDKEEEKSKEEYLVVEQEEDKA